LTINDQGSLAQVFVSNVLSGTVTRIDLKIPKSGPPIVQSMTQVATGYIHRPDPNALLVGPTGLAFDAKHDILYVASTGDNAIFAIPNALFAQNDFGTGTMIYQDAVHLHGPLGLVLAPNGDLIAANGDAVIANANQVNELVEFTPTGHFVAQVPVDFSGTPGGAFGIALGTFGNEVRFAAVDDNLNAVDVWTFDPKRLA
jgi:sugar lactone lactonase YvrE